MIAAFNPVFTPFPTLSTERLLLREITEKDLPEYFLLRSNPEVLRHIGREPAADHAAALAHIRLVSDGIASNQMINWGISLPDQPEKIIGTIGYWHFTPQHYRAELGYVLMPEHWGKGLMREAVKKVLSFGFDSMGLHSVEANINPENAASAGVLESSGFVKEGHIRENYFFSGVFGDTIIYSCLRPS